MLIAKKVLPKHLRVNKRITLTLHLARKHTSVPSPSMLPFLVHLEDSVPIFGEIVKALQCSAASGELRTGDRFPSMRPHQRIVAVVPFQH
jgi:hypothetical protein